MKGHFKLAVVLIFVVTMFAFINKAIQLTYAAGPWYVAPGGTDVNDCLSPAAPCATINGALNKPGFVPGDTINVAVGTYTGTGDVVQVDQDVQDVILSGGWDDAFITQIGRSTIDGEGTNRGVYIQSGVTVIVEWFIIQNGTAGVGGGIANSGDLTLNDSIVIDNTVSLGSAKGGGISNSGTMTLTNSIVSNNIASQGGGINNEGYLALTNSTIENNSSTSSLGGGIYNDDSGAFLTLSNSTISGNTGTGMYNASGTVTLNSSNIMSNTEGSGLVNFDDMTLIDSLVSNNSTASGGTGGGIRNANGNMALNYSVISNNVADTEGGGIVIYGGALTLNNSSIISNTVGNGWGGGGIRLTSATGKVTINNSTISGNMATRGGGLEIATSLQINSSTISANIANEGGGIYQTHGTIAVQNSIIAENIAVDAPDCSFSGVISSGHNIIGNKSGCLFSSTTGDLQDVDPKLGSLMGSPAYHPLVSDSPAINAGDPDGCNGDAGQLVTDQRGFRRLGRCDIGSYEAQSIKMVNSSSAIPGDSLTYTIVVNNGHVSDSTDYQVTDTLPSSLTYINDSLNATGGSYSHDNGVISWDGLLNAGQIVTLTYDTEVNQMLGFIANSAVISSTGEVVTRAAILNVDGRICNTTKHSSNPVLSVGANGSWDDTLVWKPSVVKENGVYKMWYSGSDGSNSFQIGLATSADGINWTKDASNPVLSPGESWETGGITVGSVIIDEGVYKMWYTGYNSNGVGRIGHATSADGINWTKNDNNPVLDVGVTGSWEDDDVVEPTVIKDDAVYHMWYTGQGSFISRIGHATSIDGITWIKDSANPVLDIGSPGGWDWLDVYGTSVVKVGNEYKLWYSGYTLPEAWQTGYATSTNGTDWVRKETLLPLGNSGAFDDEAADYAAVIVDGAEFKVWYSGFDGNAYNIGYATSAICDDPTASLDHKVYLPIVTNPASCTPYYVDDFNDPTSGWFVDDDSNRKFAYLSGQYQILAKNPSQSWFVSPGALASDFTAEVRARRVSGTNGAYGIIFGINEDWSQFYEVLIDANAYSIWRYNNGWTALRNWTASSAIQTGTNWNDLGVTRDGANISVYVNGQQLTTVTDSTFTGLRRIGLVAQSPNNGSVDARFDDFSLAAACSLASTLSYVYKAEDIIYLDLDRYVPAVPETLIRPNR